MRAHVIVCAMRRSYLSVGVALTLLIGGCASASKQLREGEKAYQSAHYEDAIIWFDSLERDVPKMSPNDRVRYHYYRGMSAYRLSDRDEALYHLSLTRELSEREKAALDEEAREELDRLLEELTPKGATYRAEDRGQPREDGPKPAAEEAASSDAADTNESRDSEQDGA